MLRARLFGALSVEVRGRPLPGVPGFKARSLLAFLLANPGPQPRTRLAGLFWPDQPETRARASLRVALTTIRRSLEAGRADGYLVADRLSAGISAELPREIDVERFEALLAAGSASDLAEAVGLYRGPLLSDLPDEWVLAAQDDYRMRVAGACERLGDLAEQAGDLGTATEWARKAVRFEPLRESGHQALISRLVQAGRTAEAVAAFRRCQAILSQELGVGPSEELRKLVGEDMPQQGAPQAQANRPRSRDPLIGRDRELAMLRRWWDVGRFGMITGEAGIGKTRLVTELLATSPHARTAIGSGLELPGAPPFGPWSEIIRDLIRQTSPPPPDTGWPEILARLIPTVATRWGRAPCPPSPAPELERARLFEAVAEFLAWAGRDRPVLVALDDLHLADAASIALLAYLGRRLADLNALIIGTRRAVPPNPRLDAALDRLDSSGVMAPELLLAPLPAAAVRALANRTAPRLPRRAIERVITASDGNPLLARQTARALAAGEDPAKGLHHLVRAPLDRLPPPAHLLVDLATTIARPLSLAEASELLGAEALADALEADTLTELLDLRDGDRIAFTHSLLRDACYEALLPARRSRLHARIASALSRRTDRSAAEVARHHRLAGDRTSAAEYLMVAASDARSLGALGDAAALLREAAELADDDPARAAEAWLALADTEAWRGNRPECDRATDRALAILEKRGDLLALAEAYASRGRWLRTTLCYPRESLAAYHRSLELLQEYGVEAPEVRAIALAGAAWAEAMAGDPAAVEELAQAAEALGSATDSAFRAELASARATMLFRLGKVAEGQAVFAEAAAQADRDGRSDLSAVLWTNCAAAAACRGEFARALEYSRTGERTESGGPYFDLVALAGQAHALSRLGHHDAALEAAHRMCEAALRSGVAEYETMTDFDAGAIAFAACRDTEAVARFESALKAPGTRFFSRPVARLLLAEARLRTGDLAGAEAELDLVPTEPVTAADLPDTLVARLLRIEGLLAAARGDTGAALDRLAEAESGWRRRLGPDGTPADAFTANLVDLGRPAVAGLTEPAVELGRVLADRAAILHACGRAEEARTAAREASRLADAAAFNGYLPQLSQLSRLSLLEG